MDLECTIIHTFQDRVNVNSYHSPVFIRVVRDPIPVNIARKFPNQGKLKTYITINPTIQSLRVLARAITSYIAWNATGAIQSMWDKQRIES